jgi:hypothetical protein
MVETDCYRLETGSTEPCRNPVCLRKNFPHNFLARSIGTSTIPARTPAWKSFRLRCGQPQIHNIPRFILQSGYFEKRVAYHKSSSAWWKRRVQIDWADLSKTSL